MLAELWWCILIDCWTLSAMCVVLWLARMMSRNCSRGGSILDALEIWELDHKVCGLCVCVYADGAYACLVNVETSTRVVCDCSTF